MQEFLQTVIKEAGFIAKGFYEEGIEYAVKSHPGDIVTKADQETSDFLLSRIKEKYPEHGIISEEEDETINPDAEYVWVIDPIDGTRNFANHIAVWCTMIGITKNNKPYMGAIYDAMNDELFFAEVGKGAYLNGKKIKVNKCDDIEHFYLSFSAGQLRNDSPYNPDIDMMKRYFKFHNNLMGETGHWVTNYSTCLSLAHVCVGRMDAFINNSGLYHDYLAGSIIAREAGALVTNADGEDWEKGRHDIVIANPKLHKKILELF